MRDLDTPGDARHAPGQQSESFAQPVFLAFLEEDLHPEADAQDRRAAAQRLIESAAQPERLAPLHAEPERGDTRKNDARPAADLARVRGQARLGAGAEERLDNAAEVSEAEIDDGDGRAHSTPFVLGTPAIRPSRAHAWRSARANDLKTASAP